MEWQTTLAWIAIGLAGAYITWRGFRALRPAKSGCGGGCGCAKAQPDDATNQPAIIPSDQLVLRQTRAKKWSRVP